MGETSIEDAGRSFRAQTLAELIRRSTDRWPDRTAFAIGQSAYTYRELTARAERRSRQILSLGARAGDRIGILLPNCVEYVEILLGAAMVGVVVVPMNIRFKAGELRHLISDSGMVGLFTRTGIAGVVDFAALLAEALPGFDHADDPHALSLADAPALRSVVALDADGPGFLTEERLRTYDDAPPPAPEPGDPLLLVYTSGTTASPKGCILANRALLANAWAITDLFEISQDDVWWCPLPMFHIGGLLFNMVMLGSGGLFASMTHFDPDRAIDMLEAMPPTIFYPLFPTITLALTEHPRFKAADFSRLRYTFNVGPEDVQRKIQKALPQAPVLAAFGMTETSGTVAYGSAADGERERLNTCGKTMPGWEIRIVDPETGESLPAGSRGEISVRGAGLFEGYFNDPELTAQKISAEGFFRTGDVGSLDDEGRLSFHGRFKDQLKVGGENVSALEVESFLVTHPAINLAQVVGVADAKYGEVPAAFVELKTGQSLTPEEVIAFCKGRIASFKTPRYVRIVEEWPMSATKILKFRLKERLEAELA